MINYAIKKINIYFILEFPKMIKLYLIYTIQHIDLCVCVCVFSHIFGLAVVS